MLFSQMKRTRRREWLGPSAVPGFHWYERWMEYSYWRRTETKLADVRPDWFAQNEFRRRKTRRIASRFKQAPSFICCQQGWHSGCIRIDNRTTSAITRATNDRLCGDCRRAPRTKWKEGTSLSWATPSNALDNRVRVRGARLDRTSSLSRADERSCPPLLASRGSL